MKILSKIKNLFNKHKPSRVAINLRDEDFSDPNRQQPLYQYFDLSADDINKLFQNMLESSVNFIDDISLELSAENQTISSTVNLKSFLKPLSFSTETRLIDVWHDIHTSNAIFELVTIKIRIISLLPDFLEHWCGQKLLSLISFIGSILQRSEQQKAAHFYLQKGFLYIDFRPWLDSYLKQDTQNSSHWLTQVFQAKGSLDRGKIYMKNHIIFGSEITNAPATALRLYLYRMPSKAYANIDVEPEIIDNKLNFIGNSLEWLFAILTSFLLVSFLIPFGMAYVKLEPIHLDNLFSVPSILLYNTIIVLFPLILFRIVMMPMYRLWASRHGDIETLQAEVARDQIFLPILREWIIVLQNTEMPRFPKAVLAQMRSLLVKIGAQKFLLVDKITLIEKRRRMYITIITFSYLGVCLLEILFLTGTLPPPQFFVNYINKLLSWILLDK